MTVRVDVDSGLICIIDPAYLRESHDMDGGNSEWYITTIGGLPSGRGGVLRQFHTPTGGVGRGVLFQTGVGDGGFAVRTVYHKDGTTVKQIIIDIDDNDIFID